MATGTQPYVRPQTSNITSKAVQLIVSSRMIGNTVKIAKSKVEVVTEHVSASQVRIDTQVDKKMLGFNKKLLDCKELQAIVNINGKITKYLQSVCSPSDFKGGIYLIAHDLMSRVDAKLEEFAAERRRLVDEFVAAYPDLVRDSQDKLSTTFNMTDYPTPETVHNCFSLSWYFVTFETPLELREKVSAEFYDQQVAKLEEKFRATEDTITAALCEAFSQLVNKMVEKTSGAEDGKKKIFRDSLVNNLSEFFETFTPRNISSTEGSEKLSQLVEKGKRLLRGLDADDLRRKDALRESVNLGFSKIKAQLDSMMEDLPTRYIEFEDAA